MRSSRERAALLFMVLWLAAPASIALSSRAAVACHSYVSPIDGAKGCGAEARDADGASPPPAPARLEAEAARIFDGVLETVHWGYTGNGYVNAANRVGSYVEWKVEVRSPQRATLAFRYANGTSLARPLQIRLNGSVIGRLEAPPTGAWTGWRTASLPAVLEPGTNIVRATGLGVAGPPNLDHLAVTRTGAAPSWAAGPSAQRIQWHGNGHRGIAYHDYQGLGQDIGAFTLPMEVRSRIPLDGDPALNVWGNLFPIDVDGDGRFEFLHLNGFRKIRVLTADGRKLWERSNDRGRIHRSSFHRDTIAVHDVDSDGRQEIFHCWAAADGSSQLLVLRNGTDGNVRRSRPIANPATEECQMALFRFAGRSSPILLVAHRAPASAGCRSNWVDYLAKVVAFDMNLTPLWERVTCDAGHYFFGVDENRDGAVEAVFAGKYRLDSNGAITCRLREFGSDHVDTAQIGDLARDLPGPEIFAVGTTGARLHSARTCEQHWHVPVQAIPDPQWVAAGRFDANQRDPFILVQTRARPGARRFLHVLTSGGVIQQKLDVEALGLGSPLLAADLDGAFGRDEVVLRHCEVVGINGMKRVTRDWYWGLQTLTAAEQQLHPNDQWATSCLTFDVDGDGREEMVVWGRKAIAVGRPRGRP